MFSVLAFIAVVGVLVVVHEFGHFCVARGVGIKVLRFSVGFGKPIWGRRIGRDQTEFVVAAIPLGGYVKMLDDREGPVPPEDLKREFNRQPLAARTAVVMAGPLFNFLFAILAYCAMYVIGISGLRPLVGEVAPDSIAAKAGLRQGVEIVSVDEVPTPTWDAVINETVPRVVDGEPVNLSVRDEAGRTRSVAIELRRVHIDDLASGSLLRRLGIQPYRPHLEAVIGEVLAGGAAERSGLRAGDRILQADGRPMRSWEQWVEYVQERPERTIQLRVEREHTSLTLEVRPERSEAEGRVIGRIGAGVAAPKDLDPALFATQRYSLLDAFGHSVAKTVEMSAITLKIILKMLLGEASVRNLSGPISIAQFAGQSAGIGMVAFLSFLAIVSVSLGVLNLLPVPLLDGGHLLYYLIELVQRKPVSAETQRFAQQIGMVLLGSLMAIAIFNDVARILQ
ncbi:MAG: RIP metalloprotease RseP [Gammaproteobacteria bacterium]